ncbi:DUF1624 domain-containing protein [Flavicella sp.]|nr:DUF1624 domain-containing protein [Flavicella sp.]
MTSHTQKSTRLTFIDSLRSIAILLMLEGHFITHSLLPVYRDDNNPIYALWKFSRGLTAPVFFTISGLIFTYLLLKDKNKGFQNKRLKKGVKRGGLLVLLGYLLQLKLYKVFFSGIPLFTDLFAIFHVLQCIGSSLILIVCIYLIKTYFLKIPLGLLLFILGIAVFLGTPTLLNLEYTGVPKFVENILITSRDLSRNRSVFPLFPWAGFVCMGGFLGSVTHRYEKQISHLLFALILAAAGALLISFNYNLMVFLQPFTAFIGLESVQYVYEMNRVGQVFLVISTVLLLETSLKKIHRSISFSLPKNTGLFASIGCWVLLLLLWKQPIPIAYRYLLFFVPLALLLAKGAGWNAQLFYAIGQNTLFVYVLHVVLLYEGFLGLPFGKWIQAKLTPFYALFGMLLFLCLFALLTKHFYLTKKSSTLSKST